MSKIKNWQELKTIDASQIVFLCGSGISLDSPTSLPTVRYFTLETLNLLNTNKKIYFPNRPKNENSKLSF